MALSFYRDAEAMGGFSVSIPVESGISLGIPQATCTMTMPKKEIRPGREAAHRYLMVDGFPSSGLPFIA
ncbi:MAG TPA: hypothetical protein ENK43_11810 [Planctomycetes bacterium]|nr:hypothetical protein [Planctomycetota bacterium]